MGNARRWALLSVLALLIGAAAAVVMPKANAAPLVTSAAASVSRPTPPPPPPPPTPVQMSYACALKVGGLMRYVSSPGQCTKFETPVTITPGPTYVCVDRLDAVFLVAAPKDCATPKNLVALTLPPSSGSVYFCALAVVGLLAYTTNPNNCLPKLQFPVVVSHSPPVLANIEGSPLTYHGGSGPVQVTASLTVSSPDATTLTGATVAISSGLVAAEDSLGFTNQNGITGSYNAATGVLTLSGTASLADYQAALRSVTYSDSNPLAATTARVISFQVNDGTPVNNLSNTESRTVSVMAENPPVAGNVSATTDKHTAIAIDVLSSDSASDGHTLTVTAVNTTGTLGLVSINPNGTIEYNPNGQFNALTAGQTATDTFGYTISDGYLTASATVTVTITGVNDPPVISNVETTALSYQSFSPAVAVTSTLTIADDDDTTLSGATVAITSGFSAASGDTLAFTNQNGITGSYSVATGVLTLSGDASLADYQAALRSVEFSSSDPSATPAERVVSFSVTDFVGATSNTAARTIDVTPAAPTAVNHSYSAVGNTPLGVGTTPAAPSAAITGSVLNGDTDPIAGATLSVTANGTPSHGSVTMNTNGTFTYLPDAGFSGTDSFTYTIAGSAIPSLTATATVTITVGPVVWYVNNASTTGSPNGEAATPFTTLAAANAALGANSTVFLYQGDATYTGGLSMKSGDSLFGQPHGLTVDGYDLVAAGGTNPVITNSGGDGIDLGTGADVEDVDVSGASADGINGAAVNGTVTIANDMVTDSADNNGVITSGTSGTLDVAVVGSTFNGAVANYGLNINAEGSTAATVSVTSSTFDNNASIDFEFESGASATGTNSATFSGNTVDGGGGVEMGPFGDDANTITVDDNEIPSNAQNVGIGVDNVLDTDTGGSVSGTISDNTIGTANVQNSGGGDDISIGAEGAFTETLSITGNTLYQYDNFAGLYFIDREGSPTMNLTITGNTVADPGEFATNGIYGDAGAETGDAGTVCADITGNTVTNSAANGGSDIELDQFFGTTFELPGYAGTTATDTTAAEDLLASNNGITAGGSGAIATYNGTSGGFKNVASCPTP